MPGDVAPDWTPHAAEQSERMEAIGRIYRRYADRKLRSWEAIEKVREILEPVVVRVGGPQHTPEVQT